MPPTSHLPAESWLLYVYHHVPQYESQLPLFAGGRVGRPLPLHPRPLAGEPADRGALLTIIRPGRLLQRRLR